LCNLACQAIQPSLGFLDGATIVRQHDVVGRMIEGLVAKPTAMRFCPGLGPWIDPAMAQQERLQLLTRPLAGLDRRFPRPHQIAHRFMPAVRDPNRRQLACPEELCQVYRVATVGLDPIARPRGDQ
jgi:hypothetical protein